MTLLLPIGSISAVKAPLSVSGASGASGVSGATTGAAGAASGGGNLFTNALNNVQNSLDHADGLAKQLATGELTDVHVYTAAATKAELAVQLTVAVRDRLVEAYQEIMRMQV